MMTPIREGWEDRYRYGLFWSERLYRRPWWKHLLWRVGWLAAWPFSTPRTKKATRPRGTK
jgi:hypothetical protein